jgi:cysteine sulfinate desulfinase/cysteine desulfurase-like protein
LPGATVLNDVVLNQVLFRLADDDSTAAVLSDVQARGVAWMGGTTWQGRPAIRFSVSNWRTTEDDVDRTLTAFERALAASQSSPAA